VLVYVTQRLLTAFVTLFGMSVLIFVLLRLVPGDIVDIIFSSAGFVNPAAKAELARELGVDRPVALQYVRWLGELAEGNLGKSYRYDVPAWQVVKPRIPVTLELALLAILVAVVLGVFTGVLSAARQDSALDYSLRLLSLAGLSMPSFWLGMLIILALVSWTGWIPALVYVSPREDLRAHLLQFIFPALAVGYRGSALIMRITRSSMLEVLREDYIRTARAKGQREWPIIFGHALRNAILPIVTVIGFEFAFMIGGLVVTETVFNVPGVARYLVDAILWRDYPVAQNLVMLIAVAVVLVNLSVDLLYGCLDPRIRYGSG
jgi:peptide/nickel transport system permease protein